MGRFFLVDNDMIHLRWHRASNLLWLGECFFTTIVHISLVMGRQQMFGLNIIQLPELQKIQASWAGPSYLGWSPAGPWVFNTSDGGIPPLQRSSLTSELFPCKTRGNQVIIKMALSKNGEYDDQPLVFGVRKQWYHVFKHPQIWSIMVPIPPFWCDFCQTNINVPRTSGFFCLVESHWDINQILGLIPTTNWD